MRKMIIVGLLGFSIFGLTAQAKGSQRAISQVVRGDAAIKAITETFLSGHDFEGSNESSRQAELCTVHLERKGSDLEITVHLNGKAAHTLHYISTEQYLLTERYIGHDGSWEVKVENQYNDFQTIRLINADDAYQNVTTKVDGLEVSCQMDM